MNDVKTDEKDEKDFNSFRINDYWGEHNISSRIMVITLVSIMIAFSTALLLGVESIPVDYLKDSLWSFTAIIAIYALGPKAIQNAAALMGKIKGFK